MRNGRKHEPLILKSWQRVFAAVIGILSVIAVAWYGLREHLIFVVASSCTGAPIGCAVQVSGEPNAAVIIALVVIGAIWLLIAVGGRVPGFDFAGFGMHLPGQAPEADIVSPSELPPQSASELSGSRTVASDDEHAIASVPGGLSPRDIYFSLPLDVRLAADNTWSSTFPRSLLSDAANEVRPGRSDGENAWFIGAVSPLGEKLWLRVTRAE